jgi:hypothetical protein
MATMPTTPPSSNCSTQKLGIEVQSLDIRKPEDVDAAFDKASAFGAKAVPIVNPIRWQLIENRAMLLLDV